MKRQSGLSASYLLLIIVIIIIAAAVLFPAVERHRRSDWHNQYPSCLSNQKQIGLAIMQYVQDYDQKFPFVDEKKCLAVSGDWKSYWSYILEPYVKRPDVFHCPKQKMNTSLSAAAKYGVSHDYIAALFADGQKDIWLFGGRRADGRQVSKPGNLEKVPAPASVILVYESGCAAIQGRCQGYFTPALMGDDEAAPMPHSEGGNFVFADGHVKWYRTKGLTWTGPSAGRYYDVSPYHISVRKDYEP